MNVRELTPAEAVEVATAPLHAEIGRLRAQLAELRSRPCDACRIWETSRARVAAAEREEREELRECLGKIQDATNAAIGAMARARRKRDGT